MKITEIFDSRIHTAFAEYAKLLCFLLQSNVPITNYSE